MDQYEVEVKFIGGHNPDLVLYDAADAEFERIDLTQYKDQGSLHGVMADKGVKRKAVAAAEVKTEV